MIKPKIFFLAVSAILLISQSRGICQVQSWQELKGEHFLIYFTGDEKFAIEVLNKAEVYYRNIASEFGYARYSEFWTWDKRVKIYIYPERSFFQKATAQPFWSQGVADYKNKQIVSYVWSKGFLESLLPHEIAHLVFRDFIGFKSEVPLWLDEGVAQWAEEFKRQQVKIIASQLLKNDTLLSLDEMMRLDIKKLGENDKLVNIYYLQAASLVGFLIEKYGSDSFADFCRQLRDGKGLQEALKSAYPTYIRDLQELENRWRQYLQE